MTDCSYLSTVAYSQSMYTEHMEKKLRHGTNIKTNNTLFIYKYHNNTSTCLYVIYEEAVTGMISSNSYVFNYLLWEHISLTPF
jgi:hypothetical protein